MMQPEEPFEAQARAVSRDLNKFRERRLADRRFQPRDSADRRTAVTTLPANEPGNPDDQEAPREQQ